MARKRPTRKSSESDPSALPSENQEISMKYQPVSVQTENTANTENTAKSSETPKVTMGATTADSTGNLTDHTLNNSNKIVSENDRPTSRVLSERRQGRKKRRSASTKAESPIDDKKFVTTKERYAKTNNAMSNYYIQELNDSNKLRLPSQYEQGGKNRNKPIIFSGDQNYFYVTNSHGLKMYRTQNGELVGKIENTEKASISLVSVILTNDKTSGRDVFYFFYKDNSVDIYDAKLLSITKSVFLNHRPSVVTKTVVNGVFYYVSTEQSYSSKSKDVAEKFTVYRSDFSSSTKNITKKDVALVKLKGTCLQIEQTTNGKHVALLTRKRVYTINTQNQNRINSFGLNTELSVFAINPKNVSQLAVGDKGGKIHICHQVFEQNANVVKSVVHWHSSKVSSLEYASDGNYLLSGGNEAVLVFWQLSTLQRDFLPRLGSEIVGISLTDDSLTVGVTLSNNSVIIVDFNSKKLVSMISGLQIARSTPGLAVYPKKPWITVSGSSGMLQTYDLINDKHISNLEVINYNHINSNFGYTAPKINFYKYSKNGKWIVTVDTKTSKVTNTPALKFMAFDDSLQKFVLNTKIKLPHLNNLVNDVAISSTSSKSMHALCATCESSTIKLWEYDQADVYGSWKKTNNSLELLNGVDDSIKKLSFSNDGSVLMASTANKLVYLISTSQMKPVAGPICISSSVKKLVSCSFLGVNSEYISNCTDNSLTILDAINLDAKFQLSLPPRYRFLKSCTSLSVDTNVSKFAVLTQYRKVSNKTENKFVMVFKIIDRQIKLESIAPIDHNANVSKIIGFAFVSVSESDDSLIILDNSSNFKLISLKNLKLPQPAGPGSGTSFVGANLGTPENDQQLFNSIFKSTKSLIESKNKSNNKTATETETETNINSNTDTGARSSSDIFFDTNSSQVSKNVFQFIPTHQMPSVKVLFTSAIAFSTKDQQSIINTNTNSGAAADKSQPIHTSEPKPKLKPSAPARSEESNTTDSASVDIGMLSESNSQALDILENIFSMNLLI